MEDHDHVPEPEPTDPPTHHENVHFYGTPSVDIDGELAQLDADGYRSLRLPGQATIDLRHRAELPIDS